MEGGREGEMRRRRRRKSVLEEMRRALTVA